jgi:hypothetical protein
MKNTLFIKTIVIAGLALISCGFFQAFGAAYVIGLSPYLDDAADREKALQQILLLMLQGAATGDDITVCDALNRQVVTRFSIPEGGLFQDNAQARARHLAPNIVAIKKFLLAERAHSSELAGSVRLPEFLDLVGSQLRASGQTLKLILIGSPYYVSDDGAFDERDAFPSDANLTSDQQNSPFGTSLRKNTLAGVTVHYAYLRNSFVNDFHQERITRFLVLFLKEQGGCLATFAPDPSLAFQRAHDNIQQPVVQAEIDPNDTKLEMRHVRARSIPLWFGPTNFIQNTILSNFVSQNSSEAANPAPATNNVLPQITTLPSVTNKVAIVPPAGFPVAAKDNILGIGLMWAAPGADIDLHVTPNPSAHELYYGYTQSKWGKYFHDYRDANEALDYEYVELKAPIDIRSVSAWANYYAGNYWPIRGKVIVYYEGKAYLGEFSIAGHKGNRGLDSQSRNTSLYWDKIDLLKIVGLDQAGQTASASQ